MWTLSVQTKLSEIFFILESIPFIGLCAVILIQVLKPHLVRYNYFNSGMGHMRLNLISS